MNDDLISRAAAIDLVKDVCNAIMSGCGSHYDEETGDEVFNNILEVDAILKCNKEIRTALKHIPSAQPETHEERTETHGVCLDVISRQEAIDALMEFDKKLRKINWYQYPYTEHECRGVDEAIVKIANLPSAQPEIIRCKDCRWRKDQSGSTAWLPCRAIVTPSDFYCCRAERRTDE